MIKKIYAFGSSFTEGGGFEFQVNPTIKYAYSNLGEKITKFNFSYPGQLQKLLPNVEVINLAKSGYGNERIYRLASDLVLSSEFNSEETLFLFEFSHLGRKEFFSRKLNDYIILNYNSGLGGNPPSKKPSFSSVAREYNTDIKEVKNDLSKLPSSEFFEKFLKLTIDGDVQHELVSNNSTIFLSFIKNRNIKYLLVEPPFYVNPSYWNNLLEPSFIKVNKDRFSIHDFCKPFGARISEETKKFHEDEHYGLISNKLIASIIYDEMCNRNFISEKPLNKTRKDFDDIQKIIDTNVLKLKGFI